MVIKRFTGILGSRRIGKVLPTHLQTRLTRSRTAGGLVGDGLPEGDSPEAVAGRSVVCVSVSLTLNVL